MKSLIFKTFKIILPNCLLNIYRNKKKQKVNSFNEDKFIQYVYKKNYGFLKQSKQIETLAISSSHTDYGFYPYLIKNSYNLGLPSADLYTTYQLYELNRFRLEKLKNVIIFYSVFSNGFSLIKTNEKYRTVFYKYFLGIPYQESTYIDESNEKLIIKKCNEISIINYEDSYLGYDLQTYYGTKISPEDRVKSHLRENLREPDQLIWFSKLIESIKADKRNMVIVLSPVRKDYKSLLPDKEIIFKKLYQLRSNNFIIIDLYDEESFTDADFGDTDHLNEIGANKATNIIKLHLDNLNI